MENFKDLVKFNRYKSVESFNNATDVTSSTISIVKLDKNVMDIYLGRTQLTHSNFPEVSVELRNLIDSLGNKLNELKTDFNSKLASADEKYDKKLSEYIAEFENGLIDLVNYTDELSKEIFDVKSDIQKKYDGTNKQIKDITDSIADINGLISNQNRVTNELSNKVADIKAKQTSTINNLKNLNQDVVALKDKDSHILGLISGIQTDIKKISVDINGGNDSLNGVSDRVSSIENTTININTDIKSLKDRINKINSNLSNDIKTNRNDITTIKKDILELTDILTGIKEDTNTFIHIKHDITNLFDTLDIVKKTLSGIEDNKKSITSIITKQNSHSNDINSIKNDIAALQIEDSHIFEILGDIQKTLSKVINGDDDISIADLIVRLSKLENIDVGLNNNIIILKEKLEKVKNDLLKSITSNKTNISNIEVKIEDIYKKISNINITDDNGGSIDLEPIKNDIISLTKSIDAIKIIVEQYKTKISKLESDQISSINKIKNISNDISALKTEDDHIFELISNIQKRLDDIANNNVEGDVENLKNNVETLFADSKSIKSDIKNISNNISNINTALSKRLNITESDITIIKNNIVELEKSIGNINGANIDISPIISDIANIKQNINDVSKDLLDKIEKNLSEINKLKIKDTSFANDIYSLKKDVIALQIEDTHIFEILNELQSINKNIVSDIKLIREDNDKINDEILSIKEKIEYLSGVNVDKFETLEGINRRLNELESADKSFQKTIDDLNETIKDGVNAKLKWLIL